jgi:hypothetical protein
MRSRTAADSRLNVSTLGSHPWGLPEIRGALDGQSHRDELDAGSASLPTRANKSQNGPAATFIGRLLVSKLAIQPAPDRALPWAEILQVSGWGKKTVTRGGYRLFFRQEDGGRVEILTQNGKMAYSFAPQDLAMSVKNGQIRSGTHLMGGGFGLEGAAIGMLGAAAINSVTARNKHYALLTLSSIQTGLTPRTVVLGYKNTRDAEVTRRVLQALAPLMDYWVAGMCNRLEMAADPGRVCPRPMVDLMASRGILTAEQRSRLEPDLQPSVDVGQVDGSAVKLVQLAPPATDDTVGQLERLAALRATGVLTDDEFAAAKMKLLR